MTPLDPLELAGCLIAVVCTIILWAMIWRECHRRDDTQPRPNIRRNK